MHLCALLAAFFIVPLECSFFHYRNFKKVKKKSEGMFPGEGRPAGHSRLSQVNSPLGVFLGAVRFWRFFPGAKGARTARRENPPLCK